MGLGGLGLMGDCSLLLGMLLGLGFGGGGLSGFYIFGGRVEPLLICYR